jgi:hypothetical protein
MIAVRICHALKGFYLGVDMFNGHSFLGKPFVIHLLPLGKFMAFAFLLRYLTVGMKLRYSLIPKIRLYQD